MRTWSKRSAIVRQTLDKRLQRLCDRLQQEVCDISLLEGHRGEAAQNAAFDSGHSKLRWPDGNHNKLPSTAVDLQPYPRPKHETKLVTALAYIAGRAHGIAEQEGFSIRWGGDWDSDGDFTDQTFDDLFHFELRGDV